MSGYTTAHQITPVFLRIISYAPKAHQRGLSVPTRKKKSGNANTRSPNRPNPKTNKNMTDKKSCTALKKVAVIFAAVIMAIFLDSFLMPVFFLLSIGMAIL